MSNKQHPLFKVRTEHRSTKWNPSFDLDFIQCPVCKRWFNLFYYRDEVSKFRGIKQHISIWAKKEATAHALGEIKKMPHFDFWREHTRVIQAIPKNREWQL